MEGTAVSGGNGGDRGMTAVPGAAGSSGAGPRCPWTLWHGRAASHGARRPSYRGGGGDAGQSRGGRAEQTAGRRTRPRRVLCRREDALCERWRPPAWTKRGTRNAVPKAACVMRRTERVPRTPPGSPSACGRWGRWPPCRVRSGLSAEPGSLEGRAPEHATCCAGSWPVRETKERAPRPGAGLRGAARGRAATGSPVGKLNGPRLPLGGRGDDARQMLSTGTPRPRGGPKAEAE